MSAVRELMPAGIGVAMAAVVTYLALDRGWTMGPWLLGLLLFAHGWVHAMWLFPAPDPSQRKTDATSYPFAMSESWLINRLGLDAGHVRAMGTVLIALTFVAFALAALATLGWLVPAGWWEALVLAAAGLSTVLLGAFYATLLLLGFAINAALAWLVLASFWAPGQGLGS